MFNTCTLLITGAGGGGGGGPEPIWTVSKTTVLSPLARCAFTARPVSRVAGIAKVIDDPASTVQLLPSADVNAVKASPARVTLRYTGMAPAGLASLVVVPPGAVRTCTLIPAPGEASTA